MAIYLAWLILSVWFQEVPKNVIFMRLDWLFWENQQLRFLGLLNARIFNLKELSTNLATQSLYCHKELRILAENDNSTSKRR